MNVGTASLAGARWLRDAVEQSLGVRLSRASRIPWGIDWLRDVKRLRGDHLSTVFDVGANRGQTAQAICRALSVDRIYSFEPSATFDVLARNTRHLPSVQTVRCALGDKAGSATMYRGAKGSGGNSLNPNGGEPFAVEVSTLDAYCAQNGIGHIDLLKIDTEGFEMPVLRGAASLLERQAIDLVLAECDFDTRPENPHGHFFELHGHLTQHGFRVAAFYAGISGPEGWNFGDCLFVRVDH